MGSNQFQREYIEYLQKRNTELLNRLNYMKENYENKILLRDINKHYLMSALEELLSLCTVIPQEIDVFFDNITAAMSTFKNILLRKSEMVQLVEKISKALNSIEKFSLNSIAIEGSDLLKNMSEPKSNKKGGTVRVPPTINGHIISTQPRIYLSRVPGVFTPGKRNESQLSPIIEESPELSSDPSNLENHIFREIRIPLERLNLNKISYNYINEESPKSRFKGPKTWKKSLSSTKQQNDTLRNTVFMEKPDNINKTLPVGEGEVTQQPEDDPLEGPSWLHDENPGFCSFSNYFNEYKRRKHRFATVFDNDEDCLNGFEKNFKKSLKCCDELYENLKRDVNEEENLGEVRGKISTGSEDLIGESFSSDCDENHLPFKKQRKSSNRKRSRESGITDDSDKEFYKEISTPYAKKKKVICGTVIESSDEESNENKSLGNIPEIFRNERKSSKKRPSESTRERVSAELSFEKTSKGPDFLAPGVRKSKKSKDTKRKKSLKECPMSKSLSKSNEHTDVIPEKNVPKKSKTSEKKSKKGKSRSSEILPQENEGKKKRKAAPSFKLVEPKLTTKLRRE